MKLAGARVLSLDAFAVEPMAGSIASTTVTNWPELLRQVGFDSQEVALVIINRIEGVPRAELPARLGWPARVVEAVRRRVSRKLQRLQPVDAERPVTLSRAALIGKTRACDPSGAAVVVRFPTGGIAWQFRDGP
ncbi:MAG: hypothetical protein FJW34_03535 [Acidobacteria bacterium]|nr:hypothetical protein [Acidobacteriota bacterium]